MHGSPESEPQDEHEGLVDAAQVGSVQPAGRGAETPRVDDRRLLDELQRDGRVCYRLDRCGPPGPSLFQAAYADSSSSHVRA